MTVKKGDFILIGLLIVLNVILRVPWFPHEVGWDSFTIHALANSLSSFGGARWWIHPMSVIGSYPYSYSSSLPFFLSGFSQIAGIDVEKSILLFGLIMGTMSAFFAYIMAGVIWDDRFFKFYVAFIFSTAQSIVTFTTWTANARTLFVVILPVFIYLLLKIQGKEKIKFTSLMILMLFLLVSTHKLYYYAIPLLGSFIGLSLIYYAIHYIGKRRSLEIKNRETLISIFYFTIFLIMFIGGFFNRSLMETDPRATGSRYGWIIHMIIGYSRYLGFTIVFAISGYLYLLSKKGKSFQESYLLLSFAAIAPLLYNLTYTKWFITAMASLFAGLSLSNLSNVRKSVSKNLRNSTKYVLIGFLVLSLFFTAYFQFLHFLNSDSLFVRHMEDETYTGGLWVRDNLDGNLIGGGYIKHRIHSASGSKFLTGFGASDLAYDFVDPSRLEIEQVYQPNQLNYYVKDPFVAPNLKDTSWVAYNILTKHWARRLISQYDISYYTSNTYFSTQLDLSISGVENNIYDNGKIKIWEVGG